MSESNQSEASGEEESSSSSSSSSLSDLRQTLGQEAASQSSLRDAARALAAGDVFKAKTLAEEALRLSPKSAAVFEFLASLHRGHLGNETAAVRFEAAAATIDKDLKKLVNVFQKAVPVFGDSRMLRQVARQVIKLAATDQQRTQFVDYITAKQIFREQSLNKLRLVLQVSIVDQKMLIAQLHTVTQTKQRLRILQKIVANTTGFQFLFGDQKPEETELFIYSSCMAEIDSAAGMTKIDVQRQLLILLKYLIPKIPQNIRLSVILSLAALRAGSKEHIDYCARQIMQTTDLAAHKAIIKEYVELLVANNAALSLQLTTYLVKQDESWQMLHAKSLFNAGHHADAARELADVINASNAIENVDDNITARILLGRRLLSQQLPIQKLLAVLHPQSEPTQGRVAVLTYLPTQFGQYLRQFRLSTYMSAQPVKDRARLDVRLRALAAVALSRTEERIDQQLYSELAFEPIATYLLLQLMPGRRQVPTSFYQLMNDALRCGRLNDVCPLAPPTVIHEDQINRWRTHTVAPPYATIYADEIMEIFSEFPAVGAAMMFIRSGSAHSPACVNAKKLLIICLLMQLHKVQLIQLTEQLVRELQGQQLELAILTKHEEVAYHLILQKASKNPTDAGIVNQLVSLSLFDIKQRSKCIKLIKRWSKNNDYLHLQTALVALGMAGCKAVTKLRETVEREHQRVGFDQSLELVMIHLYLQLYQSKKPSNRTGALEAVVECYKRFAAQPPTIQHIYNCGVILMNQLDLPQLAAQHFRCILGIGNGVYVEPGAYDQDMVRRAAYNLQLIYQMQGADELAQDIIDKFLTIE